MQSGDSIVKREAVVRNRRDVVPLTSATIQKFRRHLTPLLPLLKSLGGNLLLPEVSHTNAHGEVVFIRNAEHQLEDTLCTHDLYTLLVDEPLAVIFTLIAQVW